MRRLLLPLLLAGLVVFWLAGTASAHNVFIGSTPSNGSTVATGPRTVTLRFNQPVQQGPNTVTVTGPDKKEWQANDGEATVDGNNVRNAVRPLGPAGRYTIGYHIISADGHPLTGSVEFTLDKAGHGTPNPDVSAKAASSGGGQVPVWVWIVGAALLLGIGFIVALRTSRGSG